MKFIQVIAVLTTFLNLKIFSYAFLYENELLDEKETRFVFLASFLNAFNHQDEFIYKFVVYYFGPGRNESDLKKVFYHLKYKLNGNDPNFHVDEKIFEIQRDDLFKHTSILTDDSSKR
ncbi:unnamed protein product [Brachionus calyciflorus]|uniref:Uncharacterized protein n=1 Tax=Brachionus calyciflorus TaxID=104777 RepID=A0A814B1Q5_9BILA|nr:unnamed protein product [Brachionus calyciflorus]